MEIELFPPRLEIDAGEIMALCILLLVGAMSYGIVHVV